MLSDEFDLETIRLTVGSHSSHHEGVCLLEAAAWMAGEEHSDHPACVSTVLGAFGRRLNDRLLRRTFSDVNFEPRLRALVPKLIGTAGHQQGQTNNKAVMLVVDWVTRRYIPTLLRIVSMKVSAAALEEHPEILHPAGIPKTVIRNLLSNVRMHLDRAVSGVPGNEDPRSRPQTAILAHLGDTLEHLVDVDADLDRYGVLRWVNNQLDHGETYELLPKVEVREETVVLFERMVALYGKPEEVPNV